jgi:FlaA1/EpsC-like NDP-sugar epimerase
VRVTVTGAAGAIGYAMLFRIARYNAFPLAIIASSMSLNRTFDV